MQVYPVSNITTYLRELLESDAHLADLWVSGEVSNLTRSTAGHLYFTLKDADAQLRCVFFRGVGPGRPGLAGGERRPGGRPRPHLPLRGAGRPAVLCRLRPARGHGRPGDGVRAAQGAAGAGGAVRRVAQAAAAGVPAAHRRRHLAHGRRLPRHLLHPRRAAGRWPRSCWRRRPSRARRRRRASSPRSPLSTTSRRSTSSSSPAAAARWRSCGPSTRRRWRAPSTPAASPSCRRWATRPTTPSPTTSPTCARPRPRRRRSWWRPTGGRCR